MRRRKPHGKFHLLKSHGAVAKRALGVSVSAVSTFSTQICLLRKFFLYWVSESVGGVISYHSVPCKLLMKLVMNPPKTHSGTSAVLMFTYGFETECAYNKGVKAVPSMQRSVWPLALHLPKLSLQNPWIRLGMMTKLCFAEAFEFEQDQEGSSPAEGHLV